MPEEWGGDTIIVPISAKTGMGLDELLEMVLLTAEVQELKANPNRRAKGVVIEARLDKTRGPVATLLVQNGTLKQGDIVIAGTAVGRVRVMTNDKGRYVTDADVTERFLQDFRWLVSTLYAEVYGDYFASVCHAKGLLFENEPYVGPFDEMRLGRAVDVPDVKVSVWT